MTSSPNRRRIVITGVSRGLGREMAIGFAAAGHDVLGVARSAKALDELRELLGAPHKFEALDVTDAEAVDAYARRVVADGGPPDLLINNAAMVNDPAPIWEVPREQFDTLIDVNIKGVANVMRAFMPAIVARGNGVVVNISSGWGQHAAANVAPYCASKFAIEGLSKSAAQEVPDGVAVIPLSPGVIGTDMLQTVASVAGDIATKQTPQEWRAKAIPFILALGVEQNGNSVLVP